ncbi:dihydrodipicolinate synthase family protein [Pseudonocardia adelaidensis]|uniref:Dihydrodipicolinate synthase family protein n=1 Tax=Pseudonocardia adelaidensis TaxID=648754 RepID=A0ABP9NUX6_9PSEU
MSRLTDRLRGGVVIPAHPLALTEDGAVDLVAQRALTRYYAEAGAHGVAVGVHTTQFALHADQGLLAEVWRLAAAAGRGALLVAGVCGDVADAVREAGTAAALGYDAALLCPWGMEEATDEALLERARAVGEILPTIGFYLQESVGGRRLGRAFWRDLFDIETVVAVKSAPFDRYRSNDVVQALLEHDRWADVAVLTGNDDAIVHDLVTPVRRTVGGRTREVRTAGGLLGQWAVGTAAAVGLVAEACAARDAGAVPTPLLAAAADLVEINAAVFDVDHGFAGCVAGVNEVLRQQGLLRSARCLSAAERLSPGQRERIQDVRDRHPGWLDEEFVAEHRDRWLA